MPVLLHRLNNATQILTSLNSLLALGPDGRALFEARASDLAYASERVDELGWCLAVAASALGADLLLARRDRAGLVALVELVGEVLRRDGRALARPEHALPVLCADVAHGWQLPWTFASWLWTSGSVLAGGAELEWHVAAADDRVRLVCRAPWSDAHARARDAWATRLPGARFEQAADARGPLAILSMPSAWFAGAG
ncbi:MAG: hypothetical protein ACKVWV_19595 [Planctomycetota bacterium]